MSVLICYAQFMMSRKNSREAEKGMLGGKLYA